MSTSFYLSFGLLLSFLILISYSSVSAGSYQQRNALYDDSDYNSNEDNDVMIYPKYLSLHRQERSSIYHPRMSRNSWFRASTYQHMKPHGASEDKSPGDNLMRWG